MPDQPTAVLPSRARPSGYTGHHPVGTHWALGTTPGASSTYGTEQPRGPSAAAPWGLPLGAQCVPLTLLPLAAHMPMSLFSGNMTAPTHRVSK